MARRRRRGRNSFIVGVLFCYLPKADHCTLGVYHTTNAAVTYYSNYDGKSDGKTLAQNLANVDVLIVELGTNDIWEQVGSPGDAVNAGTIYGSLRWVCETYLAANPAMHLVLVTNQFETGPPVGQMRGVANAEEEYGKSMGIPVINMYNIGGVNAFTASTLLRDGLHPSDVGFANFYGPVIAQELLRFY
jgi:lysophospholipase L1-like esterase